MTTDNRTNEQIVAEALGRHNAGIAPGYTANPFNQAHAVVEVLEAAGRLVAAQGAAPQASQCGARWMREEGSENIPPGDWHCALPLNHGGNHVDGADGTRWGRHRDYGGVPGDAVGTFYPPTGVAPVLPSSSVDEDRAEAVREVARYIDRIAPNGLVSKKMILADIELAADRLGRGIHANGNNRAGRVLAGKRQGGESRGE